MLASTADSIGYSYGFKNLRRSSKSFLAQYIEKEKKTRSAESSNTSAHNYQTKNEIFTSDFCKKAMPTPRIELGIFALPIRVRRCTTKPCGQF